MAYENVKLTTAKLKCEQDTGDHQTWTDICSKAILTGILNWKLQKCNY